jgi:hypothetical protein
METTKQIPVNEHERHDTLDELVYYPEHPPRTESPTFLRTKKDGHDAKLPCAISGHVDHSEYHHFFIEWAFADAVDWETVKKIGAGELKVLPVLDPCTDQPTGETYPIEQSLIWIICKLAEVRGFDWHAFDPTKPETFVDSMANMMVLHAKFHRHKDHGIHTMSFPEWIFQAWPRRKGFIFTPDEEDVLT